MNDKLSPWYFLGRVRLMVTKFTKDKDTNGSNCRLQINDKYCGWRDFTEEEYAAWKLHDQPGTPVPTIAEEFSNVLSVEGIRSLYQNRIKAAFEKNYEGVREINMQLAEAIPYLIGQIDVYKSGTNVIVPDEPQIDPPQETILETFLDEITNIEERPGNLYWETKLSKSEILREISSLRAGYAPQTKHDGWRSQVLDRQGWQPIENWTAPNDTTWVLIFGRLKIMPNDEFCVYEAMYHHGEKVFKTPNKEHEFVVSHFMPLPRGPHGE